MQDFPHHYQASARAATDGDVQLTSPRLVTLRSASPAEFGGPGDRWSPETLLTAAVGIHDINLRSTAAVGHEGDLAAVR